MQHCSAVTDESGNTTTAAGPRLLHRRGATLVEARRRRRRAARQAALRRPATDSSSSASNDDSSSSSSDTHSTQHEPAAREEKSDSHPDPTRPETNGEATPLQEGKKEKAAGGSQGECAAKEPAIRCEECLGSRATGTALCACVHWRAEIHRLLETNASQALADALADGDETPKTLDEHFFKGNDAKVKYYTGLPSLSLVTAVLARIRPFLPDMADPQRLSHFQMLLLTLMRLRLNVTVAHAARLFHVGAATVDRAVGATVSALHARLHPLVRWPSREASRRGAPPPFAEACGGRRVAVIVDCFELVERPKGSHCSARKTLFRLKRSRSAKYLVCVTPQGMISFVTPGWKVHGEAISDRYMAENCGILDRLWPGDLVLARRGFHIGGDGDSGAATTTMMCAEVKVPRQRRCLDAKDMAGETPQTAADLRAHVDRVVGTLHNKYTILSDAVPAAMFLPCEGGGGGGGGEEDTPFLDKVVVVCCALANLCGSVVVQHKWLLHHYG